MSSPNHKVNNRYDSYASEHDTTIVHRLDCDDSKHGKEADDGLLNHVQDSKGVDGYAKDTERESSLRQGHAANLSPEHACNTDRI